MAAGMSLFALSTGQPEDMIALEKRLRNRVTFLSDEEGRVLDALGMRDERGAPWYERVFKGARQGEIAMPATLVIGEGGRVQMFLPGEPGGPPPRAFQCPEIA